MTKTAPLLVTGGTGTLGGHVVPLLRAAGHEVRVLSRGAREGGDAVGTVLHLAGGPKGDDEVPRNPVRACVAAEVRHLVHISVIGADRVPLAWLRTKLDSERVIADSGIPRTTLRAAQFHDLTLTMIEKMTRLPVLPVPGGLRLQPVDPAEVAARLVELTLGEPQGAVPTSWVRRRTTPPGWPVRTSNSGGGGAG